MPIPEFFIPKTLDEAVGYLLKNTTNDNIEYIKSITENQFLGETHFSVGMSLRNTWGLWRGWDLAKHFNEIGIYHADDMSGIILTSFYRRVHNQDIRLQEQIKFYQDFWQKQGIDPSKQT